MKKFLIASCCLAMLCTNANADEFTNSNIIEWGVTQPMGTNPGGDPVTDGPALLFPSSVNVSGLSGPVNKISVTLNDVDHTFQGDLEISLFHVPSGTSVNLGIDGGGGNDLDGGLYV